MESTLNIKKADLESKVGHFLGYGRGTNGSETTWSTEQTNIINDCVESGQRQFYTPPHIDGYGCYQWTFLCPVTTLSLPSGAQGLDLPDDFGNLEGPIAVSTSSGVIQELTLTGDVRRMYAANPTATGAPRFASIEALRGGTQNSATRFYLAVWPEAEQAYTVTLQYSILADALNAARPYILGGAAHAETILESMLAIAEQRYHHIVNGLHQQLFMSRLLSSIQHDIRMKPHQLGRNTDRRRTGLWRYIGSDQLVTIGGVEPS